MFNNHRFHFVRAFCKFMTCLGTLATGIGVLYGAFFAVAQWKEKLDNEHFQVGVNMLDSELIATKVGGLYILDSLARNNANDYHMQVMDLLSVFIRYPHCDKATCEPYDLIEATNQATRLRGDIQEALDLIVELRNDGDIINLQNAILSYADLIDANLANIDLTGASMNGANLTDANLEFANFESANLASATLYDANLRSAEFKGASLAGAHLIGVDLRFADLKFADLVGADLTCADLTGTDLRGANLAGAHLTGADLTGADLTGTRFVGTDGTVAKNLTQGQLDSAVIRWGRNTLGLDGVLATNSGEQLVLCEGEAPTKR